MVRTIGAEEELLLVDLHTGRARATSRQVLARASTEHAAATPVEVRGGLESEVQRQQIETHTAPVESLTELDHHLRRWRHEAVTAARASDSHVAALATSPMPVAPLLLRSPRYDWLGERYRLVMRQHLACGLHVHVAVESDDEGVGVLDRIRVWLPVLLALSANSPFWGGEDTGYASYRSQLLARWPSWGPTDLFGTAAAYHRRVEQLVDTTALLDAGMVYFDARLSQHYPTVEVRTADVCLRVEDAVLVAALCRGLVETAAAEWAAGRAAPEVPTQLLRMATWLAARDGIRAQLLDPWTSRPRPAWEVVGELVSHVTPALDASGDREHVDRGLARLRECGTGADQQRRVLAHTGRLLDVVADAVQRTADQR